MLAEFLVLVISCCGQDAKKMNVKTPEQAAAIYYQVTHEANCALCCSGKLVDYKVFAGQEDIVTEVPIPKISFSSQ
jgi:hypothetical protein